MLTSTEMCAICQINEYSNEVKRWTNKKNAWLWSRFTCFLSSRRAIRERPIRLKPIFFFFFLSFIWSMSRAEKWSWFTCHPLLRRHDLFKIRVSVVCADFDAIRNGFSSLLMLHPVTPGLHYSEFGHIWNFFYCLAIDVTFWEKAAEIFWGHECPQHCSSVWIRVVTLQTVVVQVCTFQWWSRCIHIRIYIYMYICFFSSHSFKRFPWKKKKKEKGVTHRLQNHVCK